MKTLAMLSVLAVCLAPLVAQAAPTHPLAATKPMVEHNLEVQHRHQQHKRVHRTDHAHSPARDKAPGRIDGRVKAQPHLLDAR